MDPIKNPFFPGAGAPPYDLFGREGIIETARVLFARVRLGRPEKSLLLTGLRGVGKTVLLGGMERMAREQHGYKTISIEAVDGKSLALLLLPSIRQMLFELDRMEGAKERVRRGFAVLKSFVSGIKLSAGEYEIGLDIEPERGSADSGDIEIDLPEMLVALAEAAGERKTAIAMLIDEIQYLASSELGAVIMAMHRMQQRRLPLVLLGAGLPMLPALAGSSKSYAERLFSFPVIGPLEKHDAIRALRDPVRAEGADFDDGALIEIADLTRGYPYFLQEWGYQSWNLSTERTISLELVKRATGTVIRRLDENFFRVRFDRLTSKEKHFLRTMATFGGEPVKSAEIAAAMARKPSSIAPLRDRLIKKGMIYSPEHGSLSFTVPLFDAFMTREMPEEKGGE